MSETTVTESPRTAAKGPKLVRLDPTRAGALDHICATEIRTQVAQLGLIFDAGLKALGYDSQGDKIAT